MENLPLLSEQKLQQEPWRPMSDRTKTKCRDIATTSPPLSPSSHNKRIHLIVTLSQRKKSTATSTMPPMSSDCVSEDSSSVLHSSFLSENYAGKRTMPDSTCNDDEGLRCVSPRQRRRTLARVTFSSTDELQEIPHINDLSDEEVKDVWMSREELQTIRRQCATIVKFMDMDSAIRHGVCLRGLEQNTPSYVELQVAIRRQLYDAVYAIQQFQDTTGVAVPDLLSETCQKYSRESVIQAQIVGHNDAMFVLSTLEKSGNRKR